MIAALNLVGSIFFGLSAIGAYVIPSTGELLDASLANSGTFLGAICFLVGAALLIPEAAREDSPGLTGGASTVSSDRPMDLPFEPDAPAVLAVDVGGSHVKMVLNGVQERRRFDSGRA